MKFIFSYLRPYRVRVFILMIVKALGTMADLILPFLLAYMINQIIPSATRENIESLYVIGGIMLAVSIVGWLCNVRANRQAEYVTSFAVRDIRNDLFRKVEGLTATQVDELTTSSLVSRMTTDTYNLYSFFGMVQRLGIRAPLLLVGGIVMAFVMDPILALIMVALLPFISYVTIRYTKKGQPLFHNIQVQVDNLIRTLRENITGVRVVRALSMVEFEKERFDAENNETVRRELKATVLMSKIRPFVDIIMNLGLVLVLLVGAYRIYNEHTEIGYIIALITYFTLILNAMMSVTRIFIQTSRASASSKRIKEVIDMKNTMTSGNADMIEDDSKPHLAFEDVSFSYHDGEYHIENISFELYKGQTLGIIGATGSGKSTIINLLLRFYDPQEGMIKIYGEDIKEIDLSKLRSHMGLVLQSDLIFSETIYENIQFSRAEILTEEVELAAEIAQANFVKDLEAGYEHRLSQRGTNISGGQRQRLLIARALAGKPKLLVLDDASSALDYQTDMKLRQAINQQLDETTKIIIAQRISSIKDAHLILLIEDGKVVACGTHQDLMNSSKQYQILAEHQLGKELE